MDKSLVVLSALLFLVEAMEEQSESRMEDQTFSSDLVYVLCAIGGMVAVTVAIGLFLAYRKYWRSAKKEEPERQRVYHLPHGSISVKILETAPVPTPPEVARRNSTVV